MTLLHSLITQQIRETGPLTVAEYMQLALGHESHGYYMNRDPFGQKGDFITAPEVSQVFGEMIGIWAAAFWQQMGEPEIALVELGPGRGTLMQDVLRATAQIPLFHDHLCIVLVETSPALKRMQRASLEGGHPRISWQPSLEDLPELPTLFIANEFFDALPIRQFVKTPEGLKEKMVDIDPEDKNKLCFTIQEMGIRLVKGGEYSGDEVVVESSPTVRAVAGEMAQQLNAFGGGGLIVDYGYTGGSKGNTLQAVKEHGFHPVLEDPGKVDITAHVDFEALEQVFAEQGISTYSPINQGTLLSRLGAELRTEILLQRASEEQQEAIMSGVRRLLAPEQMGELFKALAFTTDEELVPPGFTPE